MLRKFLIFLFCALTLSAHALDNQFVCTFGNEVKVASLGTTEPKPLVAKSKLDKYTFMLDSAKPLKASFINLNNGLKAPLHVMKNGDAYIFVESNTADNHFIVTVFTEKKLSDGYQAVMTFHSEKPTDSNEFYAQSIRIGRCF